MDELTLLRTLRDEIAEPTAEQLAPAYAPLEARMSGKSREGARRATSSKRWMFGAGGVLVATAVAAVIVVPVLTAPPMQPAPESPVVAEPDPSASTSATVPTIMTASMVLAAAAERTADPQDLLVSPGQLLRVETSTESIQPWSSVWSEDGDPLTFPFNAFGDNTDGAILWQDVRQLYVPADRAADWTWVWNPQTIKATFGDHVDQMLADAALPENSIARDTVGTFTAPAGNMPGRDGEGAFPLDSNRPYYDEMPRDPQALLDWYRGQSGDAGAAADRWVVSSIDPLVINLAPADIRAATFRALALIDGLEVTQQGDRLATIDYRADDGMTFTFEVDMEHGYLRSVAQIWAGGDHSLTSGVPDFKQTVTIDVVDERP